MKIIVILDNIRFDIIYKKTYVYLEDFTLKKSKINKTAMLLILKP